MPFAAVQRPSIALGLLQSALARQGISCQTCYANLWYAEAMSLGTVMKIEHNPVECLVGEWVFASAAFPDFQPDADAYYRLAMPLTLVDQDIAPLVSSLRELSPAFIELVAGRILALRPRIVGCSSMFQQHCASLALLRRIKAMAPETITVLGGSNCEGPMGAASHRAFDWVDFVVSGEADLVFPRLCAEVLEHGCEVRTVLAGVHAPWHRGEAAAPRPERLVVERLDDTPIPDYDNYFDAIRSSPLRPLFAPGLLIETSRGCWWGQKHHCTFCGLNGTSMGYRSKSAGRILEEFQGLADRHGMVNFEVVDNIINLDHLKTVLPQLAASPQRFNLFYETKANLRYDQMVSLVEGGVSWIQPGIEALHDEVLKLMDKGTSALINVQLLKWARELGLRVNWNMLLGFPGEQSVWYDQLLEWLPLITHLPPPLGACPIRFDRFSPYHTRPQSFGIELTPCPTYAFIYPLPAGELEDLAYFFEDQAGSIRRQRPFPPGAPQQAVRQQLGEWQRLFARPLTPILSLEDDGESLLILDTRPCAKERRHNLSGLSREVYLACEQARSLSSLTAAFPQAQDIPEVLDRLAEQRLLLSLEGKFLALAVRGSLPPRADRYPGGELLQIPAPRQPEIGHLQALAARLSEERTIHA